MRRPRTLLHLIETSGPGGAERMLLNLVSQLPRNRFRSMVCLLRDGWLRQALGARGVETILLPQRHGLDPGWVLRLLGVIAARRVDLLHAHEFAMNTYGSMAARLAGIPIVTTVHGKNYYAGRRRRRLAYRLVSRLSRMVAVSEDVRAFLEHTVGIQPHRVTTVYNGIDAARFAERTPESRAAARAALGLPAGARVVATLGNLYPVKGHVYLLQAMRALLPDVPDVHCLIGGRGDLETELRRAADALGIADRLVLAGFRDDPETLLDAADVFALPSLSEGLPLSLLEAMAAGRPAVASSVGGIPEVITDGVDGFLVPPQAPAPLAGRLRLLLTDPALAARLAAAGRRRVQEGFDVRVMAERYEALYNGSASWRVSDRPKEVRPQEYHGATGLADHRYPEAEHRVRPS